MTSGGERRRSRLHPVLQAGPWRSPSETRFSTPRIPIKKHFIRPDSASDRNPKTTGRGAPRKREQVTTRLAGRGKAGVHRDWLGIAAVRWNRCGNDRRHIDGGIVERCLSGNHFGGAVVC